MDKVASREEILEELLSELSQARNKRERGAILSLKEHVPKFRPLTDEELFACTFPGCEAKGLEQVGTLRALLKTGALYAGCRKHPVCE